MCWVRSVLREAALALPPRARVGSWAGSRAWAGGRATPAVGPGVGGAEGIGDARSVAAGIEREGSGMARPRTRVSRVCTKTSIRSTRSINFSSVWAMADKSSAGSAWRSAWARTSARFIGPRPVKSQSAFTPSASQNEARYSALGACPLMYLRTVSELVRVSSPRCRKVRSPAAAVIRSWMAKEFTRTWYHSFRFRCRTASGRTLRLDGAGSALRSCRAHGPLGRACRGSCGRGSSVHRLIAENQTGISSHRGED